MSTRRSFLARLGAALAASTGLAATQIAPILHRGIERSPRFILNPETGVFFERVAEDVYRAIAP